MRRLTISRCAASGARRAARRRRLADPLRRCNCDVHQRLAESLGLVADYTAAFAVLDAALEHARSLIDRTKLYTIKTNVLLIMGRIPAALACGRDAARRLRRRPSRGARASARAACRTEIQTILARTAEIGIERLLDLPVMTDRAQSALTRSDRALPAGGLSVRPRLVRALTCTMVRCRSSTELPLLGARVRLVRGADRQRAQQVRGGLSLREARRRPRAQAQRPVGAVRRLLPVGDVRVALESSPSTRASSCIARASNSGLQSGDHLHAGYSVARAFFALQYPGRAARRSRDEGEPRSSCCSGSATPTNVEFVAAAAATDRLAPRRAPATATRSAADEHDETAWTASSGARQSVVRARLAPVARDPALPRGRFGEALRLRPRVADGAACLTQPVS